MKRKINIQKVFNTVSIIFLSVCALIYGVRFLTQYIKNAKKMSSEANTLGSELKKSNKDVLKKVEDDKYFAGKVDNNYVLYSGILWRAVKISNDNTVTLVSDNALTVLAYGADKDYDGSYITAWLNKGEEENSGVLEKSLNNYKEYLKIGKVCNDKINSVTGAVCKDVNEKYYFNLLTATDYAYTLDNGETFINTGESFYLSDRTDDNYIWYINEDVKAGKSKGNDIYGVKVVIDLKETVPLVGGKGTKVDPYTFDSTKSVFGSYVKLGDDTYRIIGINDKEYKLVLDGYIKENNEDVTYKFSPRSAYFDDTVWGSAAYYMNTTFLNSLSYKDVIIESNYPCGYYGSGNEYNWLETYDKTLNTKVGFLSVGDIILNHDLTDYFILNSSSSKNTFIYTYQNKDSLFSKSINSTAKLVPVITINGEKLVGVGTKSDPYRLENK